jgi:hypothetical protein
MRASSTDVGQDEMKAIKRRRLGEQAWGAVMRRFDGAGLTVSDFCAREGLNTASFYRWRARLGATGEPQAKDGRVKRAALSVQPSARDFIDLGSLPARARDAGGGLELRLDLGEGIVLQIVRR